MRCSQAIEALGARDSSRGAPVPPVARSARRCCAQPRPACRVPVADRPRTCDPTTTREEQDLAAGVVMCSVVEQGEGGDCPHEGDMVGAAAPRREPRAAAPSAAACRRGAGAVAAAWPRGAAAPRQAGTSILAAAAAALGLTRQANGPPTRALPPPPPPGITPQVWVHFTARSAANAPLYCTRRAEGGGGQPLAFLIGKGRRAPRGWELALLGERGRLAFG